MTEDDKIVHIENKDELKKMKSDLEVLIERSAHDIADALANINYIVGRTTIINNSLNSLTNVKVSNIDDGSSLKKDIDKMTDNFKDLASRLEVAVSCYINKVIAFDKGEEIDEATEMIFEQVIHQSADYNIFWLAKELFKDSKFSAITFLLAYGTDAIYEGGNFVVGDGTYYLAKQLIPDIATREAQKATSINWENVSIGTTAVIFYTALQDYTNDEGEMTNLDWARLGLDSVSSGANYATWVVIATAFGGIPGVVLASGATLALSPTLDTINDLLTGDNIVDTFKKNNREYNVSKNGRKEGTTYDALFERYTNEMNKGVRTVNNRVYSETNYKDTLYRNWEDIYKDARLVYGNSVINHFNSDLEHLKTIKDQNKAKEYAKIIRQRYSNNIATGKEFPGLYNMLNTFDFDLEEFYDYYQGSEKI